MIRWTPLLFVQFALVLFAEDPAPRSLEATLDWWRESVEFDLPGEVLREEADELKRLPELATLGEALDIRVHARLLAEDVDSARELVTTTEVAEGGEPYALIARARIALIEDELEEVVRLLQREDRPELLESCFDYPDAWLLLGRAHARAGRSSDAATMLHQFIGRAPFHPETPSAWHLLAQTAFEQGATIDAQQFRIGAQQAAHCAHRCLGHRSRYRPWPTPYPAAGSADTADLNC